MGDIIHFYSGIISCPCNEFSIYSSLLGWKIRVSLSVPRVDLLDSCLGVPTLSVQLCL